MEDAKKDAFPSGEVRTVRRRRRSGPGSWAAASRSSSPTRPGYRSAHGHRGRAARRRALPCRGTVERQVRRHRLSRPEARRKLALLRPTLDDSGLGHVDLVIEAVVEKLEVKQQRVRRARAAPAPTDRSSPRTPRRCRSTTIARRRSATRSGSSACTSSTRSTRCRWSRSIAGRRTLAEAVATVAALAGGSARRR